ncbi:MAG: pteridine reductase [Burkholderiales bacterium]|nr:pteridine reductase [Burkholderiales bacterium]
MHNKVALVTGGARRIGAAIVRVLHAAGTCVVIHHHRSEQEAKTLAAELEVIRPASTLLLRGDLLNTGDLPRLIAETIAKFGRLDVLVNNASGFYATPVGEITGAAWEDLVGSNLKAPLFLAQAAAPELKKNRGAIVNIVDIHAERPLKNYVLYSVAKSGLVGLTKSLALELGPEVRVNGVAPGAVLWPEENGHFSAAQQRAIIDQTTLKRIGMPEDIAGAVKFLAFDAPYITGQVIAVDGGRSVRI